jgi:hypothetical protein
MSTSSYDSAQGLGAVTQQIPEGVTNAVFFSHFKTKFLQNALVNYIGGASLLLIPAGPGGATLSETELDGAFGASMYYLFGSAQGLAIPGPASFYLAAEGGTADVSVLFSKSSAEEE